MAQKEKELTPHEKLKKYEEFLEELIEAEPKREGKVIGGPDEGYYKVKVAGDEVISKSIFDCKVGEHVMIVKGMIVRRMPETLISIEEQQNPFEKIDWGQIGGMKSQIERIRKTVEFPNKHKELYKQFNLSPAKGILLYGPPGCGKTLIAKAIASHILKENHKIKKQIFTYLKGGELLAPYVGESENRIKNLFESARKVYKETNVQPVVFIDEAEAILPPRGSRQSSDVDKTIVPTFLSEMDGFEGYNPFVILATNFKNGIDSAVLRPGRIDLKISIDRPDIEDCVDIFKVHLNKTKVAHDIQTLAEKSAKLVCQNPEFKEQISGALVENVVSFAIERAIMRKIERPDSVLGVTMEDIVESINEKLI